MDLHDAFNSLPDLSLNERKGTSFLVVDSDPHDRRNLRQSLLALQYNDVTDVPTFTRALDRFEERTFSHIVFSAETNDIPAKTFLREVQCINSRIYTLATAYSPTVDDLFELLIDGACGFLVKPYTIGAVEEAIIMTTKGEPISHDIRYAKNRNEALAAMMMNAFDKFLKTAQQSKTFRTAAREMPQRAIALRRAVEMAETFAENGQSGLIEALVEFCCAKAGTPRTRLGNVRKRLSHQRSGSPELDEADSALEGLLNQAVALDEEEESAKTQTALA